ncbi:MAG: hypothetical protein V1774_07825, partial [Candidatus Eisenbacteria bacterium]
MTLCRTRKPAARSRQSTGACRPRSAARAIVLAVELAVVTGIGGGLLFPARAQEGETGEGGVLFSGRTAEGIWRLTGGHLSGSLDGPVTIDQVEVQHGSLHIRAEQGLWLPESEIVELRGAVTIRDSTRTLWADRGFYHRGRQQLELEENVRGEGPEGRFEADRLRYDRQQRTLTLSGSIRMHEEDRTLSCSWLHYDLADSTGRAGEPVLIQAAADSVDIHGRLLFHDRRAGRMTIVGAEGERPRLERHFGGGAAPVVVTADTLEMATQRREGEARGAVEVVYEGAEAACERALFLMASDRIALIGRPYLWDEEGVIAGDSMAVQLQGARADRMIVWGRARSEYRPAQRPAERYFAVGDTLTAYLEGGRVRSVLLEGKAEALFLPAPEARAEGTGLNWTQAARLRLAMGDEGVERIQFEGQADGTYIAPYKGGADGGERPAAEGMGDTGGESSDPGREGGLAAGDSARARPGGPAEDLLGAFVAPVEGEYAPFVLGRIREGACQGLLKPDAALLARLPFDLREEVRYEGDRIDFDVAAEVMTIEGQGAVHYQTMGLRSEQIAFYVARDLVVAQGEPVLSDRDSEVAGTEMTYRIDRGQGLIFQGRSELDTGHYRGERIKRADSEALFVREGEFSTCDQESTHYHFHASRMKII